MFLHPPDACSDKRFTLQQKKYPVIKYSIRNSVKSVKGNSVKFGDGPAAVNGDENRSMSLSVSSGWEGAVSRLSRKSENLPEIFPYYTSADRGIL